MRYAIMGGTTQQVKDAGGVDIKETHRTGIVFATLTGEQVARLRSQGCTVSKVGEVKATVTPPIVAPPTPVAAAPTYSPEQLVWGVGLEDLRNSISPPLYGEGVNLAIIDTGILETHTKINGRVIYSKNYTSDPMRDGLNHGTGVCSIALAVAPLSNILNMKVLNDKGEGTEEAVALAIDDCISLFDTNPEIAPSVINLSLGSPDEANPSNPLRVACRAAIDNGIWVLASAGNGGVPYSITCPACERYVLAVGSCSYEPFKVSEFSSRGPSLENLVKPDGIFPGENIIVASSESDTATIAKSGTSFSTPFASGLVVGYHESIIRFGGEARYGGVMEYPAGIPAGIYTGAPRIVSPQEMLDLYLPKACIKPEGVVAGKDNDYGYGLPFGPLIVQAITAVPVMDISTILATVAPIMAIGLVGMVMVPMIKGLR